jgi:hypothetical protein
MVAMMKLKIAGRNLSAIRGKYTCAASGTPPALARIGKGFERN